MSILIPAAPPPAYVETPPRRAAAPRTSLLPARQAGVPGAMAAHPLVERLVWLGMRAFCGIMVRQRLDLVVEGRDLLPKHGPLLIAARHYHHLYDGCALLAAVPRPLHLLVGLDWVQDRRFRGLTEAACNLAAWPAVLRRDRQGRFMQPASAPSAYRAEEGSHFLRRALRLATRLLRAERALLVFPEAYPNIDPVFTPTRDSDGFLPFRDGFAKLARLAQRAGGPPVAIVPAGLAYHHDRRVRILLRFGPPRYLAAGVDLQALVRAIEAEVRTLSMAPS